MANKYLIQGETYCGDGTTSSPAASNGAAGAWNNINVLTGTAPAYGSLNAGDVVRIRGKTAAGANITITVSANVNIGKSGLTGTPVVWILDDGTTWSGITGGVLTFSVTAAVKLSVLAYNEFAGLTRDAIQLVYATVTSHSAGLLLVNEGSCIRNWKYDTSILTSTASYGPYIEASGNGQATVDRLHVVHNVRYSKLIHVWAYTRLLMIEPDIECNSALETDPIFMLGGVAARIELRGGEVRGAGATTGVALCAIAGVAGAAGVFGFGFKFPYSMTVATLPPLNYGRTLFEFAAADSTIGGFGSLSIDNYGVLDTRDAGNYPRLNAAVNNSANTPWAYMLAPAATCSRAMQKTLDIARPFTAAAATATLTLDLLVSTSFTGANKSNVWAVFSYVDNSTGAVTTISTQDNAGGALDASTAAWSATTYGAVSFDKRKLEVTTPTAIKQDSVVRVTLFWGATMVMSGQDIAIIDPAVQAS